MNDAHTIDEAAFYEYWSTAKQALKDSLPLPTIKDGHPQGGYYKTRTIKNGPWIPVAIYRESGETIVLVDGVEAKNANKTWLGCARHPVEYEAYQHRIDTGSWPGERIEPAAKEAAIGDNAPPEETIETILPRELDSIKLWLEQNPTLDDKTADEAGNKVGELRKLRSRAEAAHKEEKAPHLEAGKAVDDRYLPNVKRATVAIEYLLKRTNEYFDKKKAAAQAEANRLAAIKAAEEKAVAAARAAVGRPPIEGMAAPTPTVPPAPLVTPAKMAVGGAVGSRISQREIDVAVIKDIDLCFGHFKTNPMVVDVLQKLAQKLVDAKMDVPGVVVEQRTITR